MQVIITASVNLVSYNYDLCCYKLNDGLIPNSKQAIASYNQAYRQRFPTFQGTPNAERMMGDLKRLERMHNDVTGGEYFKFSSHNINIIHYPFAPEYMAIPNEQHIIVTSKNNANSPEERAI